MARYRKLPREIEAVQLSELGHPSEKPAWFKQAMQNGILREGDQLMQRDINSHVTTYHRVWTIHTLEGAMTAGPTDYIVLGTKGELYPVKADIFNDIYEPVEGEDARSTADD